jgi:hypothetical protein
VPPFQGLVFVNLISQGGASRLPTLRSALGWFVEAPNVMKRLSSGTPEAYLSALFHANDLFGGQP